MGKSKLLSIGMKGIARLVLVCPFKGHFMIRELFVPISVMSVKTRFLMGVEGNH